MTQFLISDVSGATAQPRNRATAQPRNRATAQPRNRATAQPRNKRKSFCRPQVSRSRSANSFNRCHNLSAVAGTRATILQPPSPADGGRAMTAGVPSVAARTHRRSRGLPQSSPSLHQSSPELHQPLRGVIQPFLHAYQSLKEARKSLQELKIQNFAAN